MPLHWPSPCCLASASRRHAQSFQPGSPYICPNNADTGLDCYLDAVVHLYTMCRHVKSIEIIEFGYAEAQEGVNGAKSEYCVDKQKINITRPYQAALREATPWREAVDHLRDLQAYWLSSMADLRWRAGEAGEEYEDRVDKVFEELSYKVDDVRVAFTTAPPRPPRRRAAKSRRPRPSRRRRPRRPVARDAQGRRDLNDVELAPAADDPSPSRRTPSRTSDCTTLDCDLSATAARSRGRFRASASATSSSRWRRPSAAPSRDAAQLVAEAGTGTGKTFAYLVPALLYGGKVIISTGTKTLQDQLFERDLPLVRDALAAPVTVALLKGRANYVCHYHLERARARGPPAVARRRAAPAARSSRSRARRSAAIAPSSPTFPRTRSIWPLVTSTRDNCLGQNCAHHGDCFVMKARKEALEADVVVVNHHLFFADVMLRDEGVAELLPNCNTVILDEAHQLPDTATLFFGEQVGAGQLGDLARDAEIVARTVGARRRPTCPMRPPSSRPRCASCASPPAKRVGKYRARRGARASGLRGSARQPRRRARSPRHRARAVRRARRGDRAGRRARATRPRDRSRAGATAPRPYRKRPRTKRGWIRWVDVTPHGFQLQASPLSIAPLMRRQVEGSARAWIFTSATLAVGRDFSHYTSQLGLDAAPRRRGTARSTIRRRRCSTCRAICRRRIRPSTPTPWWMRRCR